MNSGTKQKYHGSADIILIFLRRRGDVKQYYDCMKYEIHNEKHYTHYTSLDLKRWKCKHSVTILKISFSFICLETDKVMF